MRTALLAAIALAMCSANAQAQETPPSGDQAGAPLTRANLEKRIDAFMQGRRGLVHVRLDGAEVLAKGYGKANPQLGSGIDGDTVFGIGSRPIDFTTAAVMLLQHQGKLAFDDTLADHFDNVPADRAGMTIRHMMGGRSGLPDFPANASDADADLTWITRDEFIERTLAVPLLFAPGEGEAHSHWAFGVLAAIVEKRSGQPYAEFLRENFFDPAGMQRTGDYGESRDLPLEAFAVGGGKQVGLPNIPPNWGPTSWLVLGSGGMFSTLNDLRRFYAFLMQTNLLGAENTRHFAGETAQIDGSERGFELLTLTSEGRRNEAWILLSDARGPGTVEPLIRPLMSLVRGN
ncbi:MAG: serine hydrolase domain-containing protein [Erythrobacter sp.]